MINSNKIFPTILLSYFLFFSLNSDGEESSEIQLSAGKVELVNLKKAKVELDEVDSIIKEYEYTHPYVKERLRAKFVGARVKDPELAAYVDRWKKRIEKIIVESLPVEALQNSLQGNFQLSVRILGDGSLDKIEVNKKSRHKEIDAHILNTIINAAPFEPFSDEIKKNIDLLGITKTWSYIYNHEVGNWFLEEVETQI